MSHQDRTHVKSHLSTFVLWKSCSYLGGQAQPAQPSMLYVSYIYSAIANWKIVNLVTWTWFVPLQAPLPCLRWTRMQTSSIT